MLNNSLDQYYSEGSKPRDITDLSDLELAHLVLRYAKTHAFLSLVNVEEAKKDQYIVKDSYSMQEIMSCAIARAKSNRSMTDNFLATKLNKATDVSIVGGNLVLSTNGTVEEIKMERGMYKVADERTTEAVLCASIIVQTFKPQVTMKDKRHESTIPVPTDATGFLYPRYGRLPDQILKVYERSRDVPELMKNLVTAIAKAPGIPEYCQLSTLVPFLSMGSVGSSVAKTFTTVHGAATPDRAAVYDKLGVRLPKNQDGQYLVRAYAPNPSLKGVYTMGAAYSYLAKSRVIRGENGGGVSSLTALYYHGDVPLSFWRSHALAYNILSVVKAMLSGHKSYPQVPNFTTLESKSIAQPVLDILRLNIPTATFHGADISYVPDYGVQPLEPKSTYVQFHQISRNFSLNSKGVLTFEQSFVLVREHILREVRAVQMALPKSLVHNFFHVIACPELLATCKCVPSAQPHSGFVWAYVPPYPGKNYLHVVVGSKEQIEQREQSFSNRLVLANAFKNYYPFHRIPFFKCDAGIPFVPAVTLMRRVVSKKTSVLYVYDFVAQSGTEVEAENLDDLKKKDVEFSELVSRMLADANRMQAITQEKLHIEPVESLNDFYASPVEAPVVNYGVEDFSALTFAPPSDDNFI